MSFQPHPLVHRKSHTLCFHLFSFDYSLSAEVYRKVRYCCIGEERRVQTIALGRNHTNGTQGWFHHPDSWVAPTHHRSYLRRIRGRWTLHSIACIASLLWPIQQVWCIWSLQARSLPAADSRAGSRGRSCPLRGCPWSECSAVCLACLFIPPFDISLNKKF